MTLLERFEKDSPKRILALDGGGIRGALTLGYLQKMEDILKEQHGGDDSFRLYQYFDLIGGTSTGSIIAACLAIGMKVSEITKMYLQLGGEIFNKKYKWWNPFETKEFLHGNFSTAPLEKSLQSVFHEIKLGGDEIKTGLCLIIKRADTNSVWPLINHPKAKYYNSKDGTNKDILLRKAVRASAAAPTYFVPEIIEVGGGLHEAAFVDGGVSMANNPALQLLMIATLKGFPFNWPLGEDKLLLVSVGTGMGRLNKLPKQISQNNLLDWAKQIPDMLMQDASWQNQLMLQWLSNSPTAWEIDGEIGNLSNDLIGTNEDKKKGMLSYLRYNMWIDAPNLKKYMNTDYSQEQVDGLTEMSNAENRNILFDIGSSAAKDQVKEAHFPIAFKI